MTREEIEDEIDYWGAEIERAKNHIYEYEENIQECYDQLARLEG